MDEWYQYEANDHEEKPGQYFFYANHMPYDGLWRVNPDVHRGRDILRYPYKYRNEKKSKCQIHRIVGLVWSKVDRSFPEEKQGHNEDNIAEIHDKVMCEKVHIDRECEEYGCHSIRIWCITESENPPHSSNVAPNRRIHKSRKQWNSHDTEYGSLWIAPWSDRRMCLKYLHSHRDDMKHEDHADFFPLFELQEDKSDLKYDGSEK